MIKNRIIVCLFLLVSVQAFAQDLVFKGGHAHNDYWNKRPLLDALDAGMVGVEADVFLRDGVLLVGHSLDELKPERTLSSLYLDPLKKIIEEKGADFSPIVLMIDIKDHGLETYRELQKVLPQYQSMLTEIKGKQINQKAVTIILSGDRPIEAVAAEKQRYCFIDGRLDEESFAAKQSLIPLLSDDWTNFFQWDGTAEISAAELTKLKSFVDHCHREHKIIRFWGYPNKPAEIRNRVWQTLKDAGVDLIGCDDPAELGKFESRK
ncbi:phosphatidylinositol-specific phospholipase C/glycerophosphodiester phosphodiesterase family protein [Mangrovibacterium diazotrophicum]|uniref:Altered inheritance of mitochondria protein 6 n=1 Tax=Mangrovibacterium diazotrophicum TaxID=1261403 RepID=A0A419VYI3_9BACT|nr:phosphatidylinositol-specific phospholipase C/glycerophosphodiester phosphodiesterase family protein [Mangrovibacterium diazotrophicum]RKD88272.1 glycerophosphoryl diester phosphodiesterase [Mangrovibacterium diazotrophicum]